MNKELCKLAEKMIEEYESGFDAHWNDATRLKWLDKNFNLLIDSLTTASMDEYLEKAH